MTQTRAPRSAASLSPTAARLWRPAFATAVLSAAVLAACGGGGGGGSDPAATTVKVSGVAATGAAMAGATISVACASGTGTATSGADGSYTLTITGSLPCVLEATSGTTTLHSLVTGTGAGTVTGHITPLTEMMLASIVGQDTKTWFASVKDGSATLTNQITDGAVTSATAAVIAALQAAGVSTTALSDLLKGDLKAGTGTGYDGVLDQLGALLRQGGSSITDLSAVLAASSAASNGLGDGNTSGMLPIASLLQKPAATCGTLRSGEYWRLIVKPSTATGPVDPVTTVSRVTIDAAAVGGPTLATTGLSTETLAAVEGDKCRFTSTTSGGTNDYMFAPSGIGFARSNGTGGGDTSQRLEMLIPVQTVAVAALAGKWNGVGWYPRENLGGIWTADAPVATIAADGKWSAVCNEDAVTTPEANCVTTEPLSTGFTVNAAGGYDAQINGFTHRAFAYQSGNGSKLIVLLHANGGTEFLMPVRSRPLQSVGTAWNAWDIRVDREDIASDAVGNYAFEITGSDAATKTETRKITYKSAPVGLSYSQAYITDSPRLGWAGRAGGATANSQGGTTQVSPLYSVRTGLGFAPYLIPGTTESRLGISVTQPK